MIKQTVFLTLIFLFPVLCKSQENQFDDQGRRNGYWKVNFEGTNKPKFEGNFEHGKETGSFKFYKKGFYDHPTAIMNFEQKNDSVHVTYYTQQGKSISEGMMLDKKREGKWLYFHQESDSIMMTEIYKNDKLNGLQETFYKNGEPAERTYYSNGLKDGSSCIYAGNGQVTKELNYKNGQLHGKAVYYNANGTKIREGFYTDGKKSGHWKFFSDGKLESEEDY